MADMPEFESDMHRTAVAQLDRVAERLHLDHDIHLRLRYPRRALVVSIPVRMDTGRTEVFMGYRVHHNTVLGPTKGGLRYDADVNMGEVTALAMLGIGQEEYRLPLTPMSTRNREVLRATLKACGIL